MKKNNVSFELFIFAGLILLLISAAASISFGAAEMNLQTAWAAIFNFDKTLTEHQII